jgi:hypothetical protein
MCWDSFEYVEYFIHLKSVLWHFQRESKIAKRWHLLSSQKIYANHQSEQSCGQQFELSTQFKPKFSLLKFQKRQ